jgi:outer membrane protein W
VRGTTTQTTYDFNVAGIGSYSLNGQYYFMDGSFRPYAGVGLGVFSLAAVSVSRDVNGNSNVGDATAAQSKFGFYPRIGFDAGHFTLNIDYNVLPNSTGVGGSQFKNSYLGIRIGGFFGGGKK